MSCYKAGRDGFWIHRALQRLGLENRVVEFGEHRSQSSGGVHAVLGGTLKLSAHAIAQISTASPIAHTSTA
jgi:hypothetical protein